MCVGVCYWNRDTIHIAKDEFEQQTSSITPFTSNSKIVSQSDVSNLSQQIGHVHLYEDRYGIAYALLLSQYNDADEFDVYLAQRFPVRLTNGNDCRQCILGLLAGTLLSTV